MKKFISIVVLLFILINSYFAYADMGITKKNLSDKKGLYYYTEEYKEKVGGITSHKYKQHYYKGFYYIIKGDVAVISGYEGTKKNIKIPSKIKGYTVEGIEECDYDQKYYHSNSFSARKYTSIFIPKTIKYIRKCTDCYNFSLNNNLEKSIGNYSYSCIVDNDKCEWCKKSYKINWDVFSVFSIYDLGYYIKSFIVSKNNTVFCSVDGVLYSKDKKILYSYPKLKKSVEFTVPNSVKTVCSLNNDKIKKLNISKSVKSIYSLCYSSNLKTIIIYGNTKLYGHNAFHKSKVKYGDPFEVGYGTKIYCKKNSIAYNVYKKWQNKQIKAKVPKKNRLRIQIIK